MTREDSFLTLAILGVLIGILWVILATTGVDNGGRPRPAGTVTVAPAAPVRP